MDIDAVRARHTVVRGGPFTTAEQLLIMEQALVIVMRENACDPESAAELIRTGSAIGLGFVEVAQGIVEHSVLSSTERSQEHPSEQRTA